MENRRILKNIIFASVLLWSAFSFSYVLAYSAETTHPALTDEIVDLYNYHYSQTAFSDDDKRLIVQGSSDEDAPVIRVLNHFYDPVRNIGLFHVNFTAKTWVKSTKKQAAFSGNLVAGVSEPLFSAKDEYSWERSVYEYVHGDKSRALVGLGHTLHMIEDMTVPPHTRNDQHLLLVDDSPFEEWASKFTPENISITKSLIVERKRPVILSSIDEYMSKLSSFTNSNFFSKDTLPFTEAEDSSIPKDRYPIPEYSVVGVGMLSGGEMQSFGMGKADGVSYKLFELRERGDKKTKEIIKEYKINDVKDELVLSDYWGILSREAVLNGAGVVKLFFDEVEKEKETLALYYKNQSWFSKLLPKIIAPKYTKGDLTPRRNLASVSAVFEEPIVEDVHIQSAQIEESPQEVAVETIKEPVEEFVKEIIGEEVTVEDVHEETYEWGPPVVNIPYPGFGGDGGSSSALSEVEEAQVAVQNAPVISSPSAGSSFATSSVTFSGTANTDSIISQDFSSATTTVDSDGDWSLVLSSFSESTTTVAFVATDDGQSSEGTSVSVFVDTMAPTVGDFVVLQCSYSLRSGSCLSGSTGVTLSWTSTSTDVSYYGVATGGVVGATTTATSASATVSNGSSKELSIVVYDSVGNTATSSSQTVEVFEMPIVINEIAWNGTQASASDEWIELYNRTSYTIDLTNVVLHTDDLVPYLSLSNTISSGGYYLIERTDDTTTSVAADLATAFSGVGGGSGLFDSVEVLSLIHALGGTASTTLDATPSSSSCSGSWCGGEASTTPISMERIDPDTLGTIASNWSSNNTYTKNGIDADSNSINGTPKSRNSVNLLPIGYYCPSETSTFISGNYYTPTSGTCTYLSSALSGSRYGDIYRGTVASSTLINGHSLGSNAESTQSNDDISSPVQGEDIFVATYQASSGAEITSFRSYFQSGEDAPPHLNYGILEWEYGVAP